MSHTLSITINGTVGLQGGANAVQWPTPYLPAPDANGVRSFTLTQGAVGTFFLRELMAVTGQGNAPQELFNLGWTFIKSIAFQGAVGVEAVRFRASHLNGMRNTTAYLTLVRGPAVSHIELVNALCLLPPGGHFWLETDDTDETFAGNNVAGPHVFVFEYEFIRGFDELCCARRAIDAVALQQPEEIQA